MKMFRIGLWLVAVALAIFVGLSSYVVANEQRAPLRSFALGVPPTAAARGNVAYLMFYTRQAKNPKARVAPGELKLAQGAYRAAPLMLPALAVIAESKRGESGKAVRQPLLDLAGKLSRRNSAITAQLVEMAALRHDEKNFVAWLSRAALTSNHQRDTYVAAMALGTARPGAVDALTPVLGVNPAWADFYWLNVAKIPDSLVNAARVRVAIAGKPWNRDEATDNDLRLVRALVAQREFETARLVAETLSPALKRKAGTGNLLVNGNFARQPLLPPFDWQLAASGDLGTTVIEKEKALVISAIGGARGMAAGQLIALPGGTYDVGWKLPAAASDRSPLAVRIMCAEGGSAAAAGFALAPGAGRERISIPGGPCKWYWFAVMIEMGDNAPGVDIPLRDLSLIRVGSASVVPDVAAPRSDAPGAGGPATTG